MHEFLHLTFPAFPSQDKHITNARDELVFTVMLQHQTAVLSVKKLLLSPIK